MSRLSCLLPDAKEAPFSQIGGLGCIAGHELVQGGSLHGKHIQARWTEL